MIFPPFNGRHAAMSNFPFGSFVRRDGVALVCSIPKPHYRLGIVLRHASALEIPGREIGLGVACSAASEIIVRQQRCPAARRGQSYTLSQD